jgi:hypothetical protein
VSHIKWGARIVGVAHLVLLCIWWWREYTLFDPQGIFAAYTTPIWLIIDKMGANVRVLIWLLGALSLLTGRLTQVGALLAGFGHLVTLSALPAELITTSDQLLLMLTSLLVITRQTDRGALIARWGVWGLFTLWAWTSLSTLLHTEPRLWRWGYAISYWGWTDASPTPLALTLGHLNEWIRRAVGSLLIAGLAWGPLIALFRVRLWPVIWCIGVPLALWVGGGLPTWVGGGILVAIAIIFDERWFKSVDLQVQGYLNAIPSRLSRILTAPQGLTSAPLLIVSVWMLSTYNSGIIPLLVIAMWLLWRDESNAVHLDLDHQESEEASSLSLDEESRAQSVPRVSLKNSWLSAVILALWILLISAPIFHTLWGEKPLGLWGENWMLLTHNGDWVKTNKQRNQLIIEMSEDGGGGWVDQTSKDLDKVSLNGQPWRPLDPLRYERWYYELGHMSESEEGPLMELLEQMLRQRIQALRVQSERVNLTMILVRIRRERWVRAYQMFWRTEGQGFFSINTDLPTLLKARARVQASRRTRPQMPKLQN